MTQIHKSVALALMSHYQQYLALAGNDHSQVTLGKRRVTLDVFARTLTDIIRYRRVLLNLGVWKKDIEYEFFSHHDNTPDFHLISLTIEFD